MANSTLVQQDPWGHLKAYTRARIALGRTGVSLPTEEILQFGYAHAMARDAVHAPLDSVAFCAQLQENGFDSIQVRSAVTDRASYLLRPDLGRQLAAESLASLHTCEQTSCDLALVVGDGLSSLAVSRHALPVLIALRALLPQTLQVAPVIVAQQARVALSDQVGELLKARIVAMLVGERPGLTSPDSLGVYITYQPHVGRQDSERNCISNIRPEGLPYAEAARKVHWLLVEALRLQLSGVGLKDESEMVQVSHAQTGQLSPPTSV